MEQGHLDSQTVIYVTGGLYKSAGFGGKKQLFVKPLYSVWHRDALIHDPASRHNQNTIKRICLTTGQTEEKDRSCSAEFNFPGSEGMVLAYTDRFI